MGHRIVLIIGDNFRDQLDRFQHAEYADSNNMYFVLFDRLEDANKGYEAVAECLQGSDFLSWTKKHYHLPVLVEKQEVDLEGPHRYGWIRLDSQGTICEVVERTIPDGFHDWFEGTLPSWKLKPGSEGFNINYIAPRAEFEEERVTSGYAGSARKGGIDLDAMRIEIADEPGLYLGQHGLDYLLRRCHEIIIDGVLMKNTDIGDKKHLLDGLSEDTILTIVSVHQ